MKEQLMGLTSADVQANMIPIESGHSYTKEISEKLQETVYGQEEACDAVARRVALFNAGLSDPNRPLGVEMFLGPTGVGKCLHGKTPIYDPTDGTTKTVKQRYKEGKSFHVYSLDGSNNIVISVAHAPQKFSRQMMWRVTFENGSSISVTDGHRLFLGSSYSDVATLRQKLSLGEQVHLPSISEHDLSELPLDGQHLNYTIEDSQLGYRPLSRLCGLLPQRVKDIFPGFAQLLDGALLQAPDYCGTGDRVSRSKRIHQHPSYAHLSMQGFSPLESKSLWGGFQRLLNGAFEQLSGALTPALSLSRRDSSPSHTTLSPSQSENYPNFSLDQLDLPPYINSTKIKSIKQVGKSYYYDFEVPTHNNYWASGVFNHNTEMGHALAEHMFGDRDSEQLKIVDCAEFSDKHTVARLLASPPGYVGYGKDPLITSDLLKNRNIIVFDEIEKAAPEFHKLLLGIMEDGRMTITTKEGQEELNFSQSLIIMTSNAGARETDDASDAKDKGKIGFGNQDEMTEVDAQKIGREALKEKFPPEFLGRIDDIITFKPLEREQYDRIFHKFLDSINKDLEKNWKDAPFIGATQEFKGFLIDKIDKRYGARDMRKEMDREMLEGLADIFMGMDVRQRPIIANREGDQTVYYTLEAPDLPPLEEDLDIEVDLEFPPDFPGDPTDGDSEWIDPNEEILLPDNVVPIRSGDKPPPGYSGE